MIHLLQSQNLRSQNPPFAQQQNIYFNDYGDIQHVIYTGCIHTPVRMRAKMESQITQFILHYKPLIS